jgi:hypothetical protein
VEFPACEFPEKPWRVLGDVAAPGVSDRVDSGDAAQLNPSGPSVDEGSSGLPNLQDSFRRRKKAQSIYGISGALMLSIDASSVFPIAPTPSMPDGRIDDASTDRMIDHCVAAGADGVTILGIMGETPKLDHEEAIAFASRCIDIEPNRVLDDRWRELVARERYRSGVTSTRSGILFLTRIVNCAARPHYATRTLREARQRDRDDQCRAIEQGLDEERPAELLDTGYADGEDQNAKHCAPDVDPPRLD